MVNVYKTHKEQQYVLIKTLSDINHTNVFLGQSPKAIEIKAKTNKWDLIKLTSFYAAKETINKMKITYRWGENTCNFQNIQAARTIQYQQEQKRETKKRTTQSKNGQKT